MANVAAWAKSAKPKTPSVDKAAIEKLDTLEASPDKPGRVLHPFPRPEVDSPYDQKLGHKSLQARIAKAPLERVPVASLVSNGQKSVRKKQVEEYIAHPGAAGTHQGGHHDVDHPIITRVNGENVTYDGHHRATAAWCRGDKYILARVVDLDGKKPAK